MPLVTDLTPKYLRTERGVSSHGELASFSGPGVTVIRLSWNVTKTVQKKILCAK